MKIGYNERIDDLEYKGLKIIQDTEGFCFGIDAVLLSDFAKEVKRDAIGVDLGTGTGIISILLSAKTNLKKVFGIEIQKDVANMARKSVELNKLEGKIEILNMDLKLIDNGYEELFNKMDFVVTNPPYKKLKTGKVNENEKKYISRHEITADLEDFIKVSKCLLKDKCALYMVHRPDRLVDIITLMRKYKLEPKIIRFVYSNMNKEPVLILIKSVKNAKPFLRIEKPLIIYNENGGYTDEILEIYGKK